MPGRLEARLARLDGGGAGAGRERLAWTPWRGAPLPNWPEEALDAFGEGLGVRDDVARDHLHALSDSDVDWLLRRVREKLATRHNMPELLSASDDELLAELCEEMRQFAA